MMLAIFAIPPLQTAAQSTGQSAPREVVLGVSKVGRAAPLDAAAIERDAIELHEAATANLRRGDVATHQRILEQLVARFPESDSADRARRQLATLYAGPIEKTSSGPARVPLGHPGQLRYLGRSEPLAETLLPSVGSWRTNVRPPSGPQKKTAQDDLRAAAGDVVFFSEGSHALGARARKALGGQAAWLLANPGHTIVIEGHTDQEGNASEQLALAIARAEAVRIRLIDEGVDGRRVRVVGLGPTRRVATCADNSCADQNRRVTTMIGETLDANLSPR